MHRILICVLGLALTSCDVIKKVLPIFSPNQDWTQLGLPQRNGNGVLIQVGGSRLELSPTLEDAITRLGACTDAITYCYAPGQRDLDSCVASTNTCDEQMLPQGCCPASCQAEYKKQRDEFRDELEAFDVAFFGQPSCFPGVEGLTRR